MEPRGVDALSAPATLDRSAVESEGWTPRRRGRAAARLLAVRTAVAVPLTVAISAAMFAVASLSPFDPLAAYLGSNYQFATDGLDPVWWTQGQAACAV